MRKVRYDRLKIKGRSKKSRNSNISTTMPPRMFVSGNPTSGFRAQPLDFEARPLDFQAQPLDFQAQHLDFQRGKVQEGNRSRGGFTPTLSQHAHTGNRARVTSMGGLYDAATLCVLMIKFLNMICHAVYEFVMHDVDSCCACHFHCLLANISWEDAHSRRHSTINTHT